MSVIYPSIDKLLNIIDSKYEKKGNDFGWWQRPDSLDRRTSPIFQR